MADARDHKVEDILASIKRVLAEDSAQPAGRPAPAAPVAEPDVLELTAAAADNGAIVAPTAVSSVAVSPTAIPAAAAAVRTEQALIDERKAASMRASLDALATLAEPGAAPQIVRSGETSLEQLTRELMRPMLKDWLDTHLPPMVEAIVQREVERITRKG